MTSRETTGFLPNTVPGLRRPWRERVFVIVWALIQWPWLLISLWGGRRRDKLALLDRLGLPHDALPNLGSWKADTAFLTTIVDVVERERPRLVVEVGCGASTLIVARALAVWGGGRHLSYEQDANFLAATRDWLGEHGMTADFRHAPLVNGSSRWASCWYDIVDPPCGIDLLVIDGPPWTLNPFVRGEADRLFANLSPGATILLDDAARPGERVVARRWKRSWPGIAFFRKRDGAKGTLVGRVCANLDLFP